MSESPATTEAAEAAPPLAGEPGIPDVTRTARVEISKKALSAVGAVLVLLVTLSAVGLQHLVGEHKKGDDAASRPAADRPSAATAEPRKLDMSLPTLVAAASAPAGVRVPALVPTADDLAQPIAVRRSGPAAPAASAGKGVSPADAPVMLVAVRPAGTSEAGSPTVDGNARSDDPVATTRQRLDAYQRQLQGLLDTLTRTTNAATAPALPASASAPPFTVSPPSRARTGPPPQAALFAGQLQGSSTPRVAAARLEHRSLTLAKGTSFTCALKTRVVSAAAGLVGCQVQRNVYSDDGRVLLIERGSHLDGEYRVTSVRPGTVRIPVLWTRIRTPNGVTVDIDSPATGPLGESGIDGYVDNRWGERIGAAMLLSLIDDSVKLVIQSQQNDGQGNAIVLPATTDSTSKLAEKVLDSTINIPPLIYQNQGGIVGIYVARDVDFSGVYELKASGR